MRLSAEAMNAALADFHGLQYQTKVASAYDVFLAMKWVAANRGGQSAWQDVADAVHDLFVVYPNHELGRLKPCRYDWLLVKDSGRKTVWNNNTRATGKLSSTLLNNQDIRNGLLPNASQLLSQALPAERPSWQSLAVLVLRNHQFSSGDDWPQARAELLARLGMSETELQDISSSVALGQPLLGPVEWDETTVPEDLRPPEGRVLQAPTTAAAAAGSTQPGVSISVDTRVERMLRLAVATTSSILLVGPPGTGKGTLLKWLLAELETAPERYGFEVGFQPNPMWRTPDESWSAFELIGGLAPDNAGELVWSRGALLDAIDEDRWLILDETNRGDMDKIMGPLLTWLSNQEVEVGRTRAHGGRPITIGWGGARQSGLDDQGPTEKYLAGTNFRLLGTYNPQDAQRVFRFGQALSRRFMVIPIPAVKPGQFTQILGEQHPNLATDAVEALTGLYSAHLADEATALGPAVFLRMARYLVAGLLATARPESSTGELSSEEDAQQREETLDADSSDGPAMVRDATPPAEPPVEPDLTEQPATAISPAADEPEVEGLHGAAPDGNDGGESPIIAELLAEAYVTGVGRYLAGYDDRVFQSLGDRITNDEAVLPQEQWAWVSLQRSVLS